MRTVFAPLRCSSSKAWFTKEIEGFRRFLGAGLVERVELITQIDRHNRPFVNYVLDCWLVDLSGEGLNLAWNWIAARRDPTKSLEEALQLAPSAWRRWVELGPMVKEQVRQRMAQGATVPVAAQRPDLGTPAAHALSHVVAHYKKLGAYQGVGEHRLRAWRRKSPAAPFARAVSTSPAGSRSGQETAGSTRESSRSWVRREPVETRRSRSGEMHRWRCSGDKWPRPSANRCPPRPGVGRREFVTTGYLSEQAQRGRLSPIVSPS